MAVKYLYRGTPAEPHCTARVMIEPLDGSPAEALPMRLEIANKSFEFAWGHSGSGPSQLAIAILAHATGNDEIALGHWAAFRDYALAGLRMDSELLISDDFVLTWLETVRTRPARLVR
jgi:hypothetical protein